MRINLKDNKFIDITIKKNEQNVYEYYADNILIGVYNPNVMKNSKFLAIDLEKNNTISNELSAESRDEIKQILVQVKEAMEQVDLQYIKEEARENNALEGYMQKIGTKKENIKSITKIEIKQEIELSEKANDIQDFQSWLGKQIPSEFKKIGVIESSDMTKMGEDRPSTRYSLVVISKDNKVEPLKKYIPQLEQNNSAGDNSRKEQYQINADGTVEKDAVNSEYRFGEKIIQLDKDPGDHLEVHIGKYSPFRNDLVSTQMRDSNTIYRVDKEVREAVGEYRGGIEKNKESYEEAQSHEELGCKPEDLTIKEINGEPDGHQHFTEELIEQCVERIMEDPSISDVFTRKEVEERLIKNIKAENDAAKVNSVKEIEEETKDELQSDAVHFRTN